MPYRQTENVVRRLAARRDAILAAAGDAAAEGGMAAVQMAPVAARAGIAAGTVYRYFPAKTDLVAALVAAFSARELAALEACGEGGARPAFGAGRGHHHVRCARPRQPAAGVRADCRAGRAGG